MGKIRVNKIGVENIERKSSNFIDFSSLNFEFFLKFIFFIQGMSKGCPARKIKNSKIYYFKA